MLRKLLIDLLSSNITIRFIILVTIFTFHHYVKAQGIPSPNSNSIPSPNSTFENNNPITAYASFSFLVDKTIHHCQSLSPIQLNSITPGQEITISQIENNFNCAPHGSLVLFTGITLNQDHETDSYPFHNTFETPTPEEELFITFNQRNYLIDYNYENDTLSFELLSLNGQPRKTYPIEPVYQDFTNTSNDVYIIENTKPKTSVSTPYPSLQDDKNLGLPTLTAPDNFKITPDSGFNTTTPAMLIPLKPDQNPIILYEFNEESNTNPALTNAPKNNNAFVVPKINYGK